MTNDNVEALLVAQIKMSEIQIAKDRIETHHEAAHRQYKLGLWALLGGIIITLFLSSGLGIFLVIVGFLAAATQASKRGNFEKILKSYDDDLSTLSASIAQAGS